MSQTYYIKLEVEGTGEDRKLELNYVPRKGDILEILFYDEDIVGRYQVNQVIAEMTIFTNDTVAFPMQAKAAFRVIVEEMLG